MRRAEGPIPRGTPSEAGDTNSRSTCRASGTKESHSRGRPCLKKSRNRVEGAETNLGGYCCWSWTVAAWTGAGSAWAVAGAGWAS